MPGVTTTNAWQQVLIDMRTLDPYNDPFNRIDMQSYGMGGNVFHVDDIRLVGGE